MYVLVPLTVLARVRLVMGEPGVLVACGFAGRRCSRKLPTIGKDIFSLVVITSFLANASTSSPATDRI